MAINPNNGVLDIINGTLKVSSIDIKQAGGFTTAINTVARNDVLLYDDQDTNTTFTPTQNAGYSSSSGVTRDTTAIDFNDGWVYWPLQLPNSWHTEFHILIPTTGGVLTYSLFNTSEPNHTDYTANDGGYKIVSENTQNQIDVLWEGSVHATTSANVRSADWQHVNINYFQGAVSISLAGKVVLTHKFTENYQEFDSRYVGFSATSGASHKIRHLIVHNSDKWLYTKTSNASDISYVSGNVGIGSLSPTELLDVHGNVHIAKDLTVDGNLTVSGTTTFIDTQNLAIEDPIIEVARGNASDTIDAGLVITRATSNVAVAYRGDEEELALGYTQSGASDTDVTPVADGGLDVRVYGNLFANNLTTTANVEATYLKGNGSEITHVTLDQVVDCGNTTANTIHLTNEDVGLKVDGNVEANYFIGNGSLLDGISSTLQEITDNGNVTTNTIQFTNTTTAFIADSNVGIGTDTPSANLHVVGHQYVNDPPTVANSFDHSDAPLTLTHGTPTSTTAIDDPKPVLHLTRDGTSGQAYGARASFNLSRYENSGTSSRSRLDVALTDGTYAESNVMSIRADGKVGIGTTTPGYTLDVHGTANVGALTATSVSGNGSGLTSLNAGNITSGTLGTARIPNLDASKITTGTLSRPISTTTGTFSGDVEVTGELTTKSNVFLGVMSAHEKEGTLEFGRADGADRVHNIKVYNSSTQANNYMKFQIHAGGASAGTVTDNVLYLRGDGNVGIGTNSPGQKLEVGHYGGALSSDFGAIRITNHATNLHATSLARFDISLGDINSGTGSGNRKLIFNSKTTTTDSGTDILCLDGLNNNVGIGTTSPGNSRVAIYNNETDANSTSSLGLELAAPWIRIGDGIGGRTMTNGSGIKFHDSGVAHYSVGQKDGKFRIASTGIQGNELFPSGYTEGVVITTTGNVGIATDSPAYTLDVSGTLHAGNSYFDTVYIGGSTSRGLRSVSGQFGTVQTTGEGAGNWEGYSIDGRYVFMSADNNSSGIYNDLDNKWILYAYRNSYVRLYYAGAEKLATNSGGITVTGSITGSMSTSLSPGSYLTGTAYNGSTARTFDVDATDAATASKVVARDANGSFSANVVTATSVSGNGSGLTSLNASNISSGTLGTAHIPNLDAGKITSGTLTRPINASTGVFTHVSLGTNKYPTLGGNWLTIFSPSFHGNLGPNHPDPDGGILFTNTSSGSTFPWGYYMGVVKDVASTNGTTQRFDIGKSSDLNSQDSTGGSDSLTPYLTIDNGDVGIGTTSPAYKLDVHGTSNVGVLTTTSVSGNGSGLTSLNADNITSGTLGRPISTTTGTFSGVVTCNDVLKLEAGSTTGDTSVESTHKTNTYIRFGAAGSSNDWAYLRQIGGDNLIKLALDFHDDNEARFEIRKVNSSGNSGSSEVATTVFSVDDGAVTATSFSGSGSSLTSLNADNLTSGTVSSDRLSLAASDIPDLSASKITSGTLGRPISTTTGTFSGDLTVSGKIYNYNYTEVDINAPDVVSGTWTASNNSSNWGDPKFNNTYDRYRYNDASGYVEYTIPAGMKSAYLSQLQWNTGGYVDVHGVQSDGGLVFLRRINTRQAVENTNEGNPDQHDGQTITFAGSGLEHYSNIRLTNKLGRFHLTGLAFTPNENEGTEGTGMVHSAQISNLGTSTGIPTSTGTGANGTWGISITGNAASATNVRVDRDDTGDTSMYLTMVNNDTAENSKRLYMDSNLVYDNTNNELKLNSLQITDYIYHSGDTDTYFGFDDADHFRIVEGGGTRFQVDSNGYIGIGTTSPTSILTTYGGGLHDGDGAFTSKVCATLYVGRGGGSGASTLDQGTGGILEFRHDSDYKSVTIESVSEASYSQDIGLLFKTTDTSDGPQERMRIDAHGNVGIGTDSPEYKLDVHRSSNVGALTATSISGPLSGNADTATTLETARTINGVSFNGSANITVDGLNYSVNNSWLRENGDNANFKQYGNSRQMVFRTDGTSEYASGVGGYPFAWMYGGDSASNRRMLLNTSGQLWCSNYGWLHDKFMARAQVFTDNNSDVSFTGQTIDFNGSGSQTNTANRTHKAFFIDYDTSASGGTATANERNYHYAMHSDMRHSGTSQPYAFYNHLLYTRSDHTTGTCSNMRGVDNTVVSSGTGINTAIWGINTYVIKDAGSSGATTTIYGTKTEVEVDAGTVTNAYAYHAHIDRDAGTLTNGYLYYGSYAGTVTTKWGVYITGESKNYFSGNVGIGTTSPGYKLDVSGTLHAGNSYFDNVYIGGSTSRGLRAVSGNYGTVQTTGGGAGNWEGYSIDGRYVFMSENNNSCGIYNDLDNEWMVYCYRNTWVRLYYNGATKLETNNGGVTVTGTVTATTFSGNQSGGSVSATTGTFSGNVGIGTTSPSGKLHLYYSGTAANMIDKRTNISTNDYGQTLNYTHYSSVAQGASRNPDNSRGLWIGNMVDENDGSPSGANFAAFTNSFQFYAVADQEKYADGLSFTSNTDTLKHSGGNFVKVMRINADGNVGVGTTSPSYKLDVHGTANVGTLTTTSVSGNGSGLTSLNASNVSTGTLGTARIPNLDAGKITTGTLTRPISTTTGTFSGVVTMRGQQDNADGSDRASYWNYDDKVALVLEPAADDGAVAILFPSQGNKSSDFAYIVYDEDYGEAGVTAGENGALILGCENDGAGSSDHVRIKSRLVVEADHSSSDPTNAFQVKSSNTTSDLFTVTRSGNVGIGTTSPAYKLDVHGTSNVGALTATSVSGNGSGLTSLNATNISSGTLGTARIPNLDAGKITTGTLTRPISTTTGTFSGDFEVGTANLFVDVSTSNVGIGTVSPAEKLHLNGNLRVDGTNQK